VAQKTGYPPQMLELDLDLEADLGIDTVKQAEMFAEIRSTFGIAKQEDLKLSEYNTLAKVIQFAVSKMNTISTTPQSGVPAVEKGKEESSADIANSAPLSVDELLAGAPMASDVTRVLRPFLVERPPLDQCLPTGARLNGLSFIVGDQLATATVLAAEIQRRGGRVILVRSDGEPDAVAAEVERLIKSETPDGVWYLPGLSDAVPPDSSDSALWKRALDERARLPFRIAKALDGALKDRSGSFFLCATRMGGRCGLGLEGAADAAAGALCGLVKSIAMEWPTTVCKVVDFPVDATGPQIAHTLVAEAERDRAVVEIGHCLGGRYGIGVTTVRLPESEKATVDSGLIPANPVVLITGGAGDIVGQIVADLAKTCGGTYYLGDLLAPRDQDQQDIAALQADREGFKASLIERLKARGERVTPVLIDRSLREVERRAAMMETVRSIGQGQATAIPVAFDVTDAAAVSRVVSQIIEKHGRLDWILHAAGLEHSQGIARKSAASFDLIFGVKAEGLHALLQATRQIPSTRLVLFGSVAGRFGNAGQTDYAAANDLLAKFAQSAARLRPGLSAVTLDFSGWEGRGMATRGSVPEQLARAGITLIPIAEGSSLVRRALASSRSGELVVARSLGVLFDGLRAQGADLEILRRRQAQHPDRYPLLGKVLDWTLLDGLRLEVMFDPAHDPYLNDHRIDGVVVLPGVMAVETFAEAARLLQPDMEVISVEDLAFEAPLKLYRDEPRQAYVRLIRTLHGQECVWLASMETTRSLVGGKQQTTRHFRARIRMDHQASLVKGELPNGNGNSKVLGRQAIYQAYFHGPSFQVLEKVTTSEDGQLAGWMDLSRQKPPLANTGALIARPMLTELAFQAAGIAEMHSHARLGLPAGVKHLKIHASPVGDHGRIAAKVLSQREGDSSLYGVKVVDERGFVLVELEGYRTSPLPNALPGNLQQLINPSRGR
jgi:NAD(P)-dependent dehydrogenase (short-subunit alcohol dehydrogenase family)